MRNARLDEALAGIKIDGRNVNNLRYTDDTAFMAESEELKSLLMKVKEESENVGLKLNIKKMKIGSQITADGDWSHEIKRCLLLGRKTMINLDSIIKKQRHYFTNKGPSSQSYGFSSSDVWT